MPQQVPIEAVLKLLDGFSQNIEKFKAGLGEAEKASEKVEKASSATTSSIAKGYAVATIAIDAAKMAFSAVAGIMRDAVAGAIENEKANIALGKSHQGLVSVLEREADRLNVSDNKLKGAAATILKTGMVTDKFVQDVMKGLPAFEAFGISIEQGAEMIAQGINGSKEGLRRFGIELEATATRGEVIDAIAAKMKEMEGTANEMAESSVGGINGMIEAWDDLKEAMGTGFLESFKATEEGIRANEKAARDLGQALGSSLSAALPYLEKTVGFLQKAGTFTGGLFSGGFSGADAAMQDAEHQRSEEAARRRWEEKMAAERAAVEEKAQEEYETQKSKMKELNDQRKGMLGEIGKLEDDITKARRKTEEEIAKIRVETAKREAEIDAISARAQEASARAIQQQLQSTLSAIDAKYNKLAGQLGEPTGDNAKRKARYEASAARYEGKEAEYTLKAQQARERGDEAQAARYDAQAERNREQAAKARDFADPRKAQFEAMRSRERAGATAEANVDTMMAAASIDQAAGQAKGVAQRKGKTAEEAAKEAGNDIVKALDSMKETILNRLESVEKALKAKK